MIIIMKYLCKCRSRILLIPNFIVRKYFCYDFCEYIIINVFIMEQYDEILILFIWNKN